MASKPPACTICSGRVSSSQSNASGWGASVGWVKDLALEVMLWERSGIADAIQSLECHVN